MLGATIRPPLDEKVEVSLQSLPLAAVMTFETQPRSVTKDVILLAVCYCCGMGALFSSVSVVSLVVAERVSPSFALIPPALQKAVQIPMAFLGAGHKTKFGFASASLVGAIGYAVAASAVAFISEPTLSFVTICMAYCLAGTSDPFVQLMRFAAAEISPEAFKPRAISYVLAGGSLAALLGPGLATLLVEFVPGRRYAGSYLGAAALLFIQTCAVLCVDFTSAEQLVHDNTCGTAQPGISTPGATTPTTATPSTAAGRTMTDTTLISTASTRSPDNPKSEASARSVCGVLCKPVVLVIRKHICCCPAHHDKPNADLSFGYEGDGLCPPKLIACDTSTHTWDAHSKFLHRSPHHIDWSVQADAHRDACELGGRVLPTAGSQRFLGLHDQSDNRGCGLELGVCECFKLFGSERVRVFQT